MKLLSLTKSLLLLSVAAFTGGAQAGSANFDFNTDPNGVLNLFGNSTWRETGGVGGTGYMSITDAANGQSGTIVFDDLDPGGIVNAFTFSCDLRTGGGTANPADGYSVSFAREGDPAITGGGFSKAREEGTDTGLAICLDEWDSGTPFAGEPADVVGISVRVDGVLKSNFALPTRNGNAGDTTSLQTGPAGRAPDPVTFDVADHSFVNLTVKLEEDGTLDVTYKGVPIVSNLATNYVPSPGRLVFAGRTGDANSNHHVDNIVISTTISSKPLLTAATLSAATLSAAVTDSLTVAVDPTKPFTVTIDGNAVVAAASKTGNITTFTYSSPPPAFYAVGAHALVLNVRDTNNNLITLNGSPVVAPYATLDPAWKAAAGQVNTAAETFLARIHQLSFTRTPGDANLLPLPEIQIQNGYFDRLLNTVAPNVADPAGFDNPLTFEKVITGVLNWDQASGAQGNFNAGNGFPESPIPGIPGTTGNDENIIGEIFTWLQLPSGVTRLGVNSDDGFTLSVGSSPLDFFGKVTAGLFDGGRGASDTTFEVAVPVAGLYPVRLLWWEGGGGANLEFFSVKPDGTKLLVNDTVDPAAIKAYYAGIPLNPSIHAIAPYPSTTFQSNQRHPLMIELVDGVNTVTDNTIAVQVDSVTVTPTVTNAGLSTKLQYLPAGGLWAPGTHNVSLTYTNSAAVSRTETWSFLIAPYAALDTAWKAAPGQVDTGAETFLARIHQMSFGRTPGDTNLLPLPEIQIQNGYWDPTLSTIAPNIAQPAGFESIITGVLNWDQAAGLQGNFGGETLIPGIPGTTNNDDNIVGEVFTWLQLPAGPVRLGVNSDDGFTLSVGASPLDFFGKVTAGVFNGGRGATDTQFDLEVPVAGLYPVRLLWWEGGGGANLEFFSVKPDGTRVLINDTNDVDAIKAYYAGVPLNPSIHAIAPYPGTLFKNNNKHPILIELVDGVNTVTDNTIVLKVDNVTVPHTVTNSGINTTVRYLPAGGSFPEGIHNISLTYTNSAAVSRTETWSFDTLGDAFVWKGNDPTILNILDPLNWVNGTVPPNNGTSITIGVGQTLGFAANALVVPNDGNREINIAAGGRILVENAGDKNIEAKVNIAGTGIGGTGAVLITGGGWGKPHNLFLTADTLVSPNNGQRFRMDSGPNRLDLNGKTLSFAGDNEMNLVNTNAYGTSGVLNIADGRVIASFEGSTKLDPNVTLRTAPGVLVTSWDGRVQRRDAKIELANNSIIETRQNDRDLTYTNEISIPAAGTGLLRAQLQATGQAGDGTDMRLNLMSKLTGAGTFRAVGNGTLILAGPNTHAATDLNTVGTGSVLAASNNAFGTGPVNVNTAATVRLSNAGGLEYRDSAQRDAAVSGTGALNPVLSALHSTQAYGETRFAYTGKLRNTAGGNVLYTFAGQYDDDKYLTIDGDTNAPVINNTAWDSVQTGQVTLTPGEHDIFVAVRDGGGGAGPNNGWTKGIGISTAQPSGAASTNNADYAALGDNLEVYQGENRSYANSFILNSNLVLSTERMNGYDASVTGAVSGAGNLTLVGEIPVSGAATDELILGGAGSHTGTTTLTNARVLVTGNYGAASGAVSVDLGSLLGGTGTIGGATTVNGGISPGVNGIGTLSTANSVTWEGSQGSWKWNLGAGNTSDLLSITGDFTKGGGSIFAFDFQGTGGAGTYTLVQWTGATAFTAANFSAVNLAPGSAGTFQIVGKTLQLNITAVPFGYAVWAASAFAVGTPAGDRLAGGDPDKDGITNLMEYALNTNPSAASSTPPPEVVTVGADKFLQIRWTRPNDRTDISTTGQVSTDLTPSPNWVTGAGNVTTTITPAAAGQEEVIIRSAQAIGSGPRRFLRAKVTQL